MALPARVQAEDPSRGDAPTPFEVLSSRGRPWAMPELLETQDGPLEMQWTLSEEEEQDRGNRDETRQGIFHRLFGSQKSEIPPLLTRYPVVLVHGANNPLEIRLGKKHRIHYFGRAVPYLRKLGLRVMVPRVNPFGNIQQRATQLERQIERAFPEGKVNIVAHSMGGLDARLLASKRPIGSRIASITTIATPHHGAWYADFAEEWIFRRQGLNRLGGLFGMRFDQMPVLRVRFVEGNFNRRVKDNPNVAYFSYGTATSMWKSPPFFWGMNFITRLMEQRAANEVGVGTPMPIGIRSPSGQVRIDRETSEMVSEVAPMPPATWVVKKWAGRNDGVVSLSSAVWGTYLGTIDTHHWGPMGLVTTFKEHKFWEQVMRQLAALGF